MVAQSYSEILVVLHAPTAPHAQKSLRPSTFVIYTGKPQACQMSAISEFLPWEPNLNEFSRLLCYSALRSMLEDFFNY